MSPRELCVELLLRTGENAACVKGGEVSIFKLE